MAFMAGALRSLGICCLYARDAVIKGTKFSYDCKG